MDYEEVTSEEKGGADVTVFVETVKQSDAPVGGGAGRPEWAENDARSGRATSRRNDSSATETLRGVSLLVASDGARSAVQRRRMPGASLNYLGVVLITGFTTLAHPLLEKQGFYTLDGARARIFTMPFETPNAEADGSEAGPKTNENACVRKSMWQISVRVAEAEARAARVAEELLAEEEVEDRRRRRVDNAAKAPRYLVVVDFECTCEDQEEPFLHEIIEFPAVLLDLRTGREVRHFHAFVRPTEKPVLSEFCTRLTGIDQATVDRAETLDRVLVRFCAWLDEFAGEDYSLAADCQSDLRHFLLAECRRKKIRVRDAWRAWVDIGPCLLYTSPSPRD